MNKERNWARGNYSGKCDWITTISSRFAHLGITTKHAKDNMVKWLPTFNCDELSFYNPQDLLTYKKKTHTHTHTMWYKKYYVKILVLEREHSLHKTKVSRQDYTRKKLWILYRTRIPTTLFSRIPVYPLIDYFLPMVFINTGHQFFFLCRS